VQPLRALRTQWKTIAMLDADLHGREQVKTLELEAERHLLLATGAIAQGWPQERDRSLGLAGRCSAAGAHLDRDALRQLRVAVSGT
jgi:hypothetical protein